MITAGKGGAQTSPAAAGAAVPLLPRAKGEHRRLSAVMIWLRLLGALLLAYAVTGKGIAYLGVGPVYIGEAVLAGGLSLAVFNRRLWRGLGRLPCSLLLLVVLFVWCSARTIPYFDRYGTMAMRDGAVWGYGLFAIIIYAVLSRYPGALTHISEWCAGLARTFPVVMAAVYLGPFRSLQNPLSGRLLFSGKAGDTGVHLAGAVAAVLLGTTLMSRWRSFGWILCVAYVAFRVGSANRGGMVAMVAACSITIILLSRRFSRLSARWLIKILLVVLVFGVLIAYVSVSHPAVFSRYGVNLEYTLTKYRSMLTLHDQTGTISDRLAWWGKIVQYTFGGEYFWLGKGFGINLAVDDGFDWHYSPDGAGTLRSPHNVSLTFLARAGVPGLLIWLLVQVAWAVAVLSAYITSLRKSDLVWSRWFCYLLAYWLAFHVNALFDVFLEGPMGGIWFWSLFGIGAGSVTMYRRKRGQLPSRYVSGTVAVPRS